MKRLLTRKFLWDLLYDEKVAPSTIRPYERCLQQFKGAMQDKATIEDRVVALQKRGVSAPSINSSLRVVNRFLAWMHAKGHAAESIHIPLLTQAPRQKALATILTLKQVARLVAYRPPTRSQKRVQTIACLMLSTGLQIDEALSLRRKDVNLDTLSVHVRWQGERDRLVRMSFAMGCVMSKWISAPRGNALVFGAPAGTNILQDLKDLGTSLGITGVEFSLETLQNTYAAGIPGVRELCYDHDRFTVFGRMRDAGEG